jgi:hypothetical protein
MPLHLARKNETGSSNRQRARSRPGSSGRVRLSWGVARDLETRVHAV